MTLTLAACLCLSLLANVACAKDARTYYNDEKLAGALAKVEKYTWAQSQAEGAKNASRWLVEKSDEELWDFVPPPKQARALNVSFGAGCPVHGEEVFRKGGHYPWTTSPDRPFKVKCPVGGEEYPSNDFEGWNLESVDGEPETGEGFIDKGLGWKDDKGTRYWFAAHYIFRQRWQRDILPGIKNLSQAYLLTREPVYAHKCAVLLARLAGYYEQYDYRSQAYHNGKWPAGINGRILDYIWETGTISNFARAYDAIYPAFAEDAELQAFLRDKGVDDAPAQIETKMLHVMARDIMRGFIKGNYGMYQQALATVAIVLDNDDPDAGPTTKEMVDWIMSGPGDVEYTLWNGFYRDGHGGESSPGYSAGWNSNFYSTAKLLGELGVDVWSNPKVKKMADIGIDLSIAGDFTPSIGDSGSILGSHRVGWSNHMQGTALRHYGDPRYAKILKLLGAKTESLWEPSIDQQVDSLVEEHGTDLGLKTRNLGGYGLAVLESGEGARRRGLSMYYGHAGGGHGHRDRLNIELFAYGKSMLTDMGYPAHWLAKNAYWTSNTTSHYAVLVDRSGQQTTFPGYLNTLASAPGVQLADASAEKVAYPNSSSLYRRTSALIDMDEADSYLLDIFRVQGGKEHDWSFHGPPFPEFSVAGGLPGETQTKGTLAGEDVGFGAAPKSSANVDGIVVELAEMDGVLNDDRPYADRSTKAWATYTGTSILTRKVGAVATQAIPTAPAGKVKVFLRAYDYNSGANEVEIAVGKVSKQFRWEPTGKVGYHWVAQEYDLPEGFGEVRVKALEAGQNYILIDSVIISRDTDLEAPRVMSMALSGFQYLYNIRHMAPEGSWSATWRDPESNLGLTMTMAAGCAQDVILADAEPELKPGHPDTLQYVLARNETPKGAEPDDDSLASSYIAVVEPHKGAARVSSVERLSAENGGPWAAGVQVTRDTETDLIHSSTDPGVEAAWTGGALPFTVSAEFALATVDANGIRRACLVNGTHLRCGEFEIRAEPSPQGTVLSVDHEANTVTIEGELPGPDAYVDRVMILGNEDHQTSYTIKRAQVADGQTTLHFGDILYLVGMGQATSLDSDTHTVVTDTQFTGYGRVDGGRHAGRWLYNETKTEGYRIASFKGKTITLEAADVDLNAAFDDADGDGRRQFWISDIGPGDTYRIPTTTYVERLRPGLYDVRMMTPVEVSLPAGARLVK